MMAIWAAIVFVSLSTGLLMFVLLSIAAILARYIYELAGMEPISVNAQMASFAAVAFALSLLLMSWRNARERWRNARDVAEQGLSDGARRFLVTYGYGTASFVVMGFSSLWTAGQEAAIFHAIVGGLTIILAPAYMTALGMRVRFDHREDSFF